MVRRLPVPALSISTLVRVLWPLALALVVVVAMREWMVKIGDLPLDSWSLRFTPYPPRPEPWADIGTFFELVGTPLFAAVALAITVWLITRALGWRAAAFVAVACVGVVLNGVLKTIFGATPLWLEVHGDSSGGNFPSGHVVYAVALAGSLGVLAWERRRWDLVVLAVVFAALMGPFRVAAGVHLPSDVIAGYVLGAGWLATAARLLRPSDLAR